MFSRYLSFSARGNTEDNPSEEEDSVLNSPTNSTGRFIVYDYYSKYPFLAGNSDVSENIKGA